MLFRPVLALVLGVVSTSSAVARAKAFELFSSARVAEVADLADAGNKGSRRPSRSPLLVPPVNLALADSFRDDEMRVWSATSRTVWRLLPPKLLGMAAAEAQTAAVEKGEAVGQP